ncbi:MAG: tRNA preQ1(34) S-adenosylmethionine ribosyltransferase-isomerase QueA [Candidatus Microgenomates bacterium]|jgi:S-adenosylmethionine:tRNA ribosyltransferase-isomerase
MKTSDFNYELPRNLIANSPAKPRDYSRLMVIDRKTGQISHHRFYEIEKFLRPNDVLVLNKTKVFPARLFAKKITGGKVELLFIDEVKPEVWRAMTHPGLKKGSQITFKKYIFDVAGQEGMTAIINTKMDKDAVLKLLKVFGNTPLPPYIHTKETEGKLRKEYQTVYAKLTGSVAAPTAGFHFTERLLTRLKKKGVQIEYVTLHVGIGTFAPVKTKTLEEHKMHEEEFFVDKPTFGRLIRAKKEGKRIVAVGTTSTRVLETITPKKLSGSTNIFIYPPYKFKFVDALITNFHLPASTLLALVSAFVSYPNTKEKFNDFSSSLMGRAYQEAIKEKYRFYSFGDSSLII